MQRFDLPEFTLLLDDVCSLLSRGAYQPNDRNTAMFFRALERHSLEEVRAAFGAHIADPRAGRFVPVPADILAQIEARVAHDGRPGAEEAWATAFRSADEGETIVWTAETAEAYGIALPIIQAGDEVGGRMAFKEAYNRLVDEARRDRRVATWSASLGHDTERRDRAIAAAVAAGQLDHAQYPALPALRGPVLLLEGKSDGGIPEEAREALLALREWLTTPGEYISEDVQAKERTARQKAEAAARVDAYTAGNSDAPF